MHASRRSLAPLIFAGLCGPLLMSQTQPTASPAPLPLVVSSQELYGPQRYRYNVTNISDTPIMAYVLTYNFRGLERNHFVDFRSIGAAPLNPGESSYSGLEFFLTIDLKGPLPRAILFEGGKTAGDPKIIAELRDGRSEQIRVYDAMSADISKLAASGASTDSILQSLQATPQKYTERRSGGQAYVVSRGTAAYKAVVELLKKSATASDSLASIARLKAALLADGRPDAPSSAAISAPAPVTDPAANARPNTEATRGQEHEPDLTPPPKMRLCVGTTKCSNLTWAGDHYDARLDNATEVSSRYWIKNWKTDHVEFTGQTTTEIAGGFPAEGKFRGKISTKGGSIDNGLDDWKIGPSMSGTLPFTLTWDKDASKR